MALTQDKKAEPRILRKGEAIKPKRKTVAVEVPEFECSVLLRACSYGQFKAIKEDMEAPELLSGMIVDDQGDLIFEGPEGIAQLAELSNTTLEALVKEALKLNGISKEAAEEAVKNYKASPIGVSASA